MNKINKCENWIYSHHWSVQLLCGVIVIVLVSSPVPRVGQEPALGRGHGACVTTKVPLGGVTIKLRAVRKWCEMFKRRERGKNREDILLSARLAHSVRLVSPGVEVLGQ